MSIRASRRGRRSLVVLVLGSVAAFGAAQLVAAPAGAATFNVTNNNDSGAGSLRQALLDAASAGGANSIAVQSGIGTITLSSPIVWQSQSSDSFNIQGNGVTIDAHGQPAALVADVGESNSSGALTFANFTILGVGSSTSNDAGAIVVEGGAVSISNCSMHSNAVDSTGGDAGVLLSEGGSVIVANCTITGNSVAAGDGDAGTVNAEGGDVTFRSVTISNNSVNSVGDGSGGLLAEGGSGTLTNLTDQCNTVTATGDAGGGILSEGGDFTINNSSVVGNRASSSDGDHQNQILSEGAPPTLSGTTVSDDQSVCQAKPTTTTTTTVAVAGSTTTVAPTTTTTVPAPVAPAAAAVVAAPAFTG